MYGYETHKEALQTLVKETRLTQGQRQELFKIKMRGFEELATGCGNKWEPEQPEDDMCLFAWLDARPWTARCRAFRSDRDGKRCNALAFYSHKVIFCFECGYAGKRW